MKRLFWLGVGIAVGAVAARAVSRAMNGQPSASMTGAGAAGFGDDDFDSGGGRSGFGLIDSLVQSASGVAGAMRDFVADVRVGMAVREEQIHEAFAEGVSLDDLTALDELNSLTELDPMTELDDDELDDADLDDSLDDLHDLDRSLDDLEDDLDDDLEDDLDQISEDEISGDRISGDQSIGDQISGDQNRGDERPGRE